MFVSFFPQPRLFFLSAVAWSLLLVLVWFFGGEQLGALVGLPPAAADAPPIIGVSVFWSPPFLWFYIYFAFGVAVFYVVLAVVFAASLAELVDPRLGADPVRYLLLRCR